MFLLAGIGVFLGWSMVVAISDFRHRRIPNTLVVFGLIFALVFAVSENNPFHITTIGALIGIVVGCASLFPFFVLRMMGAADVKVFAVLGGWCGVEGLVWCWVVASLAALTHVIGMMLLTRTPLTMLWHRGGPAMALRGYRASPYAAFLVIPAAVWLIYQIVTGNMQ